jgi:hypothetical protein
LFGTRHDAAACRVPSRAAARRTGAEIESQAGADQAWHRARLANRVRPAPVALSSTSTQWLRSIGSERRNRVRG